MPLHSFEAMDRRARVIRGVVDAADTNAVKEALREHGLHPLKVRPAPKGAKPSDLEAIPKAYRTGDALDLDTMKALEDRLLEGDDAAYGEIIHRLEAALETLERFPDDPAANLETRIFREMLKSLREYGSPEATRQAALENQREKEALRERALAGDPEALENLTRFKIGPAEITGPGAFSCSGTVLVEPDSVVAAVYQEGSEKKGRVLCEAKEITAIETKQWRRGRVKLTLRDGATWELRLDRKTLEAQELRRMQQVLLFLKRYLRLSTQEDLVEELFRAPLITYLIKDAWSFLRRYRLLGILSVFWGWLVLLGPMLWLRRTSLPAEMGALILVALLGLPWTWLYLHGVFIRRWEFRFSFLVTAAFGGGVLTGLFAGAAGALAWGVVRGIRELLSLVGA